MVTLRNKIEESVFALVWDDGDFCTDCVFLHRWQEEHGEGMNEPMSECTGNQHDCPGVIHFLRD